MSMERMFAEELLSNYQFAAMLLFQRHGMFEGGDRALRLVVRWRLGSDALQPEAGSGHQGEQRSSMFSGKTDDLVRKASDYRKQHDAYRKLGPEGGHRKYRRNQDVHHDRDD